MAILLSAGFAGAAININPAGNAEIAAFIESESNRILQIPDTLVLNLNFQTAHDEHGRAGFLFFWGRRKVSIKADYVLDLPGEPLKGSVSADTSWFTSYCGMLECQTRTMPAQQRIEVLRTLSTRLLSKLNGKIQDAFAEQKPPAADVVE